MKKINEARITINGIPLTFAQSCTLRVALNSFMSDMSKPAALGTDARGLSIQKLYRNHSSDMLNLIHKDIEDQDE